MSEIPISQQIDELCDAFEAALRDGKPMKIEACLQEVAPEHRETLFRELLEIELELADKVPGQPDQTIIDRSYQSRFPQYSELIAKVLFRVVKQQRIGDYEIIREIGHGGMGVVYKAKHNLLDQIVAIKVLPESLMDDPLAVARFRREMQLIGQLTHPNIVRALNAGQQDQTHYFVMEYVNGINLQQFVDRQKGRIPLPVVCEIIRQAAMGLAQIHLFQLVHRDIKPANLMLDYSGTVKIHDLGLGKFLSEQNADNDLTLTQLGTTMGTIDYMSPEQCENAGEVDIRTDIYALGCTFYFLATGHAPYSESRFDSTRKKLMAHIVGEIPPLAASIPGVEPALEQVFNKMMAKAPEDRFQTPQELAEALAPFADEQMLFDYLLAWREEQGITSEVMLTPRPQPRSATPTVRTGAKKAWPRWLAAVPVVCVVLLCLLFVFLPAKKEVPAENAAIAAEVLLLPGLEGGWWFEEIPWFIPPVREAVAGKLTPDAAQQIYSPDTQAVSAWLWAQAQACEGELSTARWQLMHSLGVQLSQTEAGLRTVLQQFSETFGNDDALSAADIHTRANLEHRLAVMTQDKSQAAKALQTYRRAAALYEKESSPRAGSLAVLARADAARLEIFASDYNQAYAEFREINGMTNLPALFRVELQSTFGAAGAEAGRYSDWCFTRAANTLEASPAGRRTHPLKAVVAQRYARSLLQQWKLAEAWEQFRSARTACEVMREVEHADVAVREIEILHGQALTLRLMGNAQTAADIYHMTLATAKQPSAEMQTLAGQACESLGDGILFGGAASNTPPAKLLEAAEFYAQAAKYYPAADAQQTAMAKQAVLCFLHGGKAQTQQGEELLQQISPGDFSSRRLAVLGELAGIFGEMHTRTPEQAWDKLRNFLLRFHQRIGGVAEINRRENLEIFLFAAEFLLRQNLQQGEVQQASEDILMVQPPLSFLLARQESWPFARRYLDLAMIVYARVFELGKENKNLIYLGMTLEKIRDPIDPPAANSEDQASLLFFFTQDERDGFALLYPADRQNIRFFRLPYTRWQVLTHRGPFELPDELLAAVAAEQSAGRTIIRYWGDSRCVPTGRDALNEKNWPFGELAGLPAAINESHLSAPPSKTSAPNVLAPGGSPGTGTRPASTGSAKTTPPAGR